MKRVTLIDRFEICQKRENASMDIEVTRIHYAKNIGTLIDAKINVYRNGFNIKVKLTIIS